MHGTYIIEVRHKAGVADPVGRGLFEDLRSLRIEGLRRVAFSQLYRLAGDLRPEERARIAEDLLVDPVTQTFQDGSLVPQTAEKEKTRGTYIVDIWFKTGVTDVASESVIKGIRDLDIESVSEVRTGFRYRFLELPSRQTAETLAVTVLSNPLVHDRFVNRELDMAKTFARRN